MARTASTGRLVARARHAARMGFNVTSELTGDQVENAIVREAYADELGKIKAEKEKANA